MAGTVTSPKVLTGLNHVFVNTKRAAPEHVLQVFEGQPLPADLKDGELDRLDKLGAFRQHPRDARQAAVAHFAGGSGPVDQHDFDVMVAALNRATPTDQLVDPDVE